MKNNMPVHQITRPSPIQPVSQGVALDDALFQHIPAMMHSIDASGTIVAVSQRWLEILGYSRSEVIGRKSTDFLTEESRAYASENILPEFFRTGRCTDVAYQLVAKDGRIIDVLLSATCERDEAGQVKRSLAVMQDITARKQAERKLDAAKAYAENLLRTASVMVVELDVHGNVKRINQAAERITEWVADEIIGHRWFETVIPEAKYSDIWSKVRQSLGQTAGEGFECPILAKSGTERQVHWRINQVLERGEFAGILCVGVDITAQKAMETRLAESEHVLREAQRVAQIGSWFVDYRGHQLRWSEEIFRILGLDPQTVTPSKEAYLQSLHPEDRQLVKQAYRRASSRHKPYEVRYRLLMNDGLVKYVCQRCEFAFDADGAPYGMVGTLQDTTLTVLQEMAFQESEERFRTIADFTFDWEYWKGNNRELLYISPSCHRITGYSQAEFVSDPDLLLRIVHPEDRGRYSAHIENFTSGEEHQLDFRIITKDGQERWIAHGCRPVIRNGKPNGRRISNRDITDLKLAEQLAQKLAYYDVLTDLPNRRMLQDRLLQAIASAKRHEHPMAMMFVDIDKFKQINDTYGHDVGDQFLIEVAGRFSGCVRASDTVSRTGGDEFIILLPVMNQREDAAGVAEKLLATLQAPIQCDSLAFMASASIGIACLDPQSNDNATELMKKADMAMYEAKQCGGSNYRLFAD